MTAAVGRHPPSLSPTGLIVLGWAAAVVAGVIFLSLAWDVATYAPLVVLDAKVATWLHKHGTPEITAFMYAITTMHSIAGSSLLALIFGLVLARMREWYWLLTLAVSMTGGLALNTLLKEVYARVRPYFDDPWVTLSTYSFPSGHTAAAVLLYGVLAAFLVSRFYTLRERAVCVIGATFAVALVAFSRMYLGAHYLSDVLAAACSSLVWLVICLSSVHALVRRRMGSHVKTTGKTWRWIVLGLALAAFAIAALYFPIMQWADSLEDRLESMGLAAGLLLYLGVATLALLLLAPAWIFQLVAGAVFGFPWGLVAAMAASMASALLALLVSRYLFRGRVEKWARSRPNFKAFDQAVSRDGWQMIALMRLSPLLGSGLKSYFFGLTRVRLGTYAAASLVGMLPGVALKVYLGAAGRDAVHGGPLEWTLLAVGIVATIAASVIVARLTRGRLKFG